MAQSALWAVMVREGLGIFKVINVIWWVMAPKDLWNLLMLPYRKKGLCKCDQVKDHEMETLSSIIWEDPKCNHRGPVWGQERFDTDRRGEGNMTTGLGLFIAFSDWSAAATSQARYAYCHQKPEEARNGFSLLTPEGAQPCPCLDFQPVKLISDSRPPECERIHLCFLMPSSEMQWKLVTLARQIPLGQRCSMGGRADVVRLKLTKKSWWLGTGGGLAGLELTHW